MLHKWLCCLLKERLIAWVVLCGWLMWAEPVPELPLWEPTECESERCTEAHCRGREDSWGWRQSLSDTVTSVALSRFCAHGPGTTYHMMCCLPSRCYSHSVSDSKLACSPNPFSDWTSSNVFLVDLTIVRITYLRQFKIPNWLSEGWWHWQGGRLYLLSKF